VPDNAAETSAAHRRSREQYAAVAANYAVSESHARGDDLAWFAARAADVVPGLAVDVACGGGFSTRALLAAGHRVVATDLTPESLAAARSVTLPERVSWVAGAAERLPIRTAGATVVGCRIAPHHFGDPARFVDEVARLLAPGGLFLLVDTTVPEDDELARWLDDLERLRDPSHRRSWPPSRWHAVLSGARLRVEELQVFSKRHEVEPWLARAGCVGDAAAAVRRQFREAPDRARSAYLVEWARDDVVAYSDTKICIRATKPA
jgi:SAM-dependent methyltransferase